MIWFRNVDRRYAFLWETGEQPPARWHGESEGPVQYLASTPDGAWAEFLRHEEITDAEELEGIARALWAVEVGDEHEDAAVPRLRPAVLTGGLKTYAACRAEARRLREAGATALVAPSAGLRPGGARGQRVAGGVVEGQDADGRVLALFGPRPAAAGWACCLPGRPGARLLALVRPLA